MAKRLTHAERVKRKLKAAQAEKGITQTDIAKVFGLPQQSVSKMYCNLDQVPLGKARRLLRILGLTLADIDAIE